MNLILLSSLTGESARVIGKHFQEVTYSHQVLPHMLPVLTARPVVYLSLGYMHKIPERIWSQFETYNLHPGTLPDLRGRHPQLRALADGREKTHVVLHRVNGEFDGGEVIQQIEVRIMEADRMDPTQFLERTRRIGIDLCTAFLRGRGFE